MQAAGLQYWTDSACNAGLRLVFYKINECVLKDKDVVVVDVDIFAIE